ncbi:hypothetical protein ACWFRM_00375 [Streptomyces sp. NPDC055144]
MARQPAGTEPSLTKAPPSTKRNELARAILATETLAEAALDPEATLRHLDQFEAKARDRGDAHG